MAVPVLTPEDFIGYHKISQNTFTKEKVQDYIDSFYEDYLIKIIGSNAYYEIDTQDPLQGKWSDLFSGVSYVNTYGETAKLTGLQEIVRGLIYFEYVRDQFTPSIVGNVKSEQENSARATEAQNNMICLSRYNKSISQINNSLACFIRNYDYVSVPITDITNAGGDTYLVELLDTIYLYDGDEVNLDGMTFTVSNLIDNTSFEVTSSSPLSADIAKWMPYQQVKLNVPFRYATL